MTPRHVHVVGAGLAGLAAALSLTGSGIGVTLHEAAAQAGGRCRSFYEPSLDRMVDNGSHLLLACNRSVLRYAAEIGATTQLLAVRPAALPFFDLRSRRRWSIRPGPLPMGLPFPLTRRPPGTPLSHFLRSAWRLLRADPDVTVAEAVAGDPAAELLWHPLALAILNTEPDAAAAAPFTRVLQAALAGGALTCRPLIARHGLSPALVDPALAVLAARGAGFEPHRRLRAVGMQDGRVAALKFGSLDLPVAPDESVILALPAAVANTVLPGSATPTPCRAIVNVHYRLPEPVAPPWEAPFLGVVGGTAQWIFVRGDVVSVTVSAAPDALLDLPGPAVAERLWPEVAAALSLDPQRVPPARTIKERRATPAHTPAHEALRPKRVPAPAANLRLAGDWTHPVWPSTIEAAVDSGRRAARSLATGPSGRGRRNR